MLEKHKSARIRVPYEISGSQETFTRTATPTQFLVNLTRYVMDEDRKNWRAISKINGEVNLKSNPGEELKDEILFTHIGVAVIRLPASASSEDVMNLAQSIHSSIRPLDCFARMTEYGYWILYQGDEVGCRRAVERVEEKFLLRYEDPQMRRHIQSSLKVRLIMRVPGEARNQWIERVDNSFYM